TRGSLKCRRAHSTPGTTTPPDLPSVPPAPEDSRPGGTACGEDDSAAAEPSPATPPDGVSAVPPRPAAGASVSIRPGSIALAPGVAGRGPSGSVGARHMTAPAPGVTPSSSANTPRAGSATTGSA